MGPLPEGLPLLSATRIARRTRKGAEDAGALEKLRGLRAGSVVSV